MCMYKAVIHLWLPGTPSNVDLVEITETPPKASTFNPDSPTVGTVDAVRYGANSDP